MSGCAGSDPYALQVLDDSMDPEFLGGDVIVIEPGKCNEDGAYVIALHNGEYIFRQLRKDMHRLYLHPLNDAYPTLAIADSETIKGRVVSKSSAKDRKRKSYL